MFALILFYAKKRFLDRIFNPQKLVNYFLVSVMVLVSIYIFARYTFSFPIWMNYILSLSVGIGFILFVATLSYECFIFANRVFYIPDRQKRSWELGIFFFMLLYLFYGIYNGYREPEVIDVELKTEKNINREFSLVQISDLHIGGIVNIDFVKSVIEKVNSLNVDLVLITGDLVDTKVEFSNEAIDELKNLKSTYGTFYVTGNHEYFHGVEEIFTKLESIGIKTLKNSSYFIDDLNINIVGITDLFGFRQKILEPSISEAIDGVDLSRYTIFLSHQPKIIESSEFKSEFDLTLSGHTHGGQIEPFSLLVRLQQPVLKGLEELSKDKYIYVNQGVGFWGPRVRIGTFSELTHFKISKR